jgi:hypothetical protein
MLMSAPVATAPTLTLAFTSARAAEISTGAALYRSFFKAALKLCKYPNWGR